MILEANHIILESNMSRLFELYFYVTRAGFIINKPTCTKKLHMHSELNILIQSTDYIASFHKILLEQYLEVSEHALCCVVELREQQSLYRPVGVPVVNLAKPKPQFNQL